MKFNHRTEQYFSLTIGVDLIRNWTRIYLLELFGNSECVTRTQHGFEERVYFFKRINIFSLKYVQRDYRYLLTREGEIIEKKLSELKSKCRPMPLWDLPPPRFDQ
jgi:hypothetical protein